ncbi:MAG: hypothetical protein IPG87_15660 [Saprospiraceae bacterium]|nr:hypothetical protein [Candidatus Vicinibacter affinis]
MHKIKFLLVALTLMYSCVGFGQPFAGKIGVGLDGIGGIALEFPNVTWTATAWQSVATGSNARTDAAGWPLEDFRVVFFDHRPTNAWNNAPDDPQKYVVDQSGTYTLSFTGQANLTSWSDAPIQFLNKTYNAVTNTTNVDIVFPPGGGPNVKHAGQLRISDGQLSPDESFHRSSRCKKYPTDASRLSAPQSSDLPNRLSECLESVQHA